LTGTMQYKDSLQGETVVASSVTIDLNGNNISKQQAMVLAKIILFSMTIPLNAD